MLSIGERFLSLSRCRACIDRVRSQINVSERRMCRVLGQHRSTQRRLPKGRADEDRLLADMIELTRQYGRYGYPLPVRRLPCNRRKGRIAALLRDAGWQINEKRAERLWRREGLKVPTKQPKRGRLWLNPSRGCAAQTAAGQGMAHASGSGQSARITSSLTTSSTAARS